MSRWYLQKKSQNSKEPDFSLLIINEIAVSAFDRQLDQPVLNLNRFLLRLFELFDKRNLHSAQIGWEGGQIAGQSPLHNLPRPTCSQAAIPKGERLNSWKVRSKVR